MSLSIDTRSVLSGSPAARRFPGVQRGGEDVGATWREPCHHGTVESEGSYAGYRYFDKLGITPQVPFG